MLEKNKSRKIYFKSLFLFLFIINIAFISSFFYILTYETQEKKSMIDRTIEEFRLGENIFNYSLKVEDPQNTEYFLKTICNITNCDQFLNLETNNLYIKNSENIIEKLENKNKKKKNNLISNSHQFTFLGTTITSDLHTIIIIKDDINAIFAYPMKNFLITILKIILISNFILFLLLIFIYFSTHSRGKKEALVDRMRLSGTLREKNMKILTENIHHELNTPLAVIHGFIEDYEYNQKQLESNCKLSNCVLYKNNLDFETIYASIDQINTVLQRMNGFKQITYSNGDKSLYDIISYSTNSMKIYKQSNFSYYISEEFKKYNLIGSLSNGDFLNVLSNFLRNSLEAKATKIIIGCQPFQKNKLKISIMDNGEGIYDRNTGKILEKKNYNKIFEAYYSTKDENGNRIIIENSILNTIKNFFKQMFVYNHEYVPESIRGVGLYLNKELLNQRNSSVCLKHTGKDGTIFELIVNVKTRK